VSLISALADDRYKRLAALATDRLYTAPRRFFASSLTDVGAQGWSYRWDESGYPGIPAELGGGSSAVFASLTNSFPWSRHILPCWSAFHPWDQLHRCAEVPSFELHHLYVSSLPRPRQGRAEHQIKLCHLLRPKRRSNRQCHTRRRQYRPPRLAQLAVLWLGRHPLHGIWEPHCRFGCLQG